MHFTDYYGIVERDHTISNPITAEKLDLMAEYLHMADGMSVLDIGSGKAWLLGRWASRWDIRGTGLEINPHFMAVARKRVAEMGVENRVRLVEGPARDFTPDPEGYDIILCIGASFALGSYTDAVVWMGRHLKPGGMIAIGEPFYVERPPAGLVPQHELDANPFLSLDDTARVFERAGLELRAMIPSEQADWDRYYSGNWNAALTWARENPDHPDRAELLEHMRSTRSAYLRWERRYLGWAIFIASHRL